MVILEPIFQGGTRIEREKTFSNFRRKGLVGNEYYVFNYWQPEDEEYIEIGNIWGVVGTQKKKTGPTSTIFEEPRRCRDNVTY